MTRSRQSPVRQPDEVSCGPAALKMALSIIGKRTSIASLIKLCQTNKNGTTTRKMIRAIKKLRVPALVMEKTTLNHMLSALKPSPLRKRAVLVSYLDMLDDDNDPDPDSGHWGVVSSYKPSTGRIVLLDSYNRQKVSYAWTDFRRRWIDEKIGRRKVGKRGRSFKVIKRKERQLMIVVARKPEALPNFQIPTAMIIN